MVRLHFVVEGESEEKFVNRLLVPELAPEHVFGKVRAVETSEHGAYRHRGGGRSYENWRYDLTLWMKQDKSAEVWFTTMIDLYQLPSDFPGFEDCKKLGAKNKQVECLEKNWQKALNHPRFIPYIQLHEFETLLFADVSQFAVAFPDDAKRIAKLAGSVKKFKSIEQIDGRQGSAPSQRIQKVFPKFRKTTDGLGIASAIGLARMCAASSHFKQWVVRLKNLGRSQGDEDGEAPGSQPGG